MKRPAFQFYPADWRKDASLQSCSVAARGLWIELMCIAHECDPYGYLEVNKEPMTAAQIARLVGVDTTECERLLSELERAAVFSKTRNGTIFSRRMVKDERLRNARARAGKLGGNPALLKHGDNLQLNLTSKQKPTPSSSSSTSVPPIPPNGNARRSRQRQPATACPTQFSVTQEMHLWAEGIGVATAAVMPETEKFIGHHRAKGSMFADWHAAWCNWMRNAVTYAQARAK